MNVLLKVYGEDYFGPTHALVSMNRARMAELTNLEQASVSVRDGLKLTIWGFDKLVVFCPFVEFFRTNPCPDLPDELLEDGYALIPDDVRVDYSKMSFADAARATVDECYIYWSASTGESAAYETALVPWKWLHEHFDVLDNSAE